MSTFQVVDDDFLLDGHPHRVFSGAVHYFRVPPQYWADRIHKARLMGLNTIETYVPWNLHQPTPGEWITEGGLDLGAFLDAIAAEGMHAIVRPGPYICAEFDAGGLPAWLFAHHAGPGPAPVRTRDPHFMNAVAGYLRNVYTILEPRQVDRGGPVILVQIENEYGAYGCDHEYLRELTDLTRGAGITVPLTTVDQPRDGMLEAGTLPDLLTTASFGSRAAERLRELRRVQPRGPLMCSEFWDGWFDQVGQHHHTTSASDAARELEELLATGASVNLYMFHGGTNPGLSNGANDKGIYLPITTSYDYDAPLDESGHPTAKYWTFREVLGRHTSLPAEVPDSRPPAPTCSGPFTAGAPLHEIEERLGEWTRHDYLPTMDELGQFQGFSHHRCLVPDEVDHRPSPRISDGRVPRPWALQIPDVRDRVVVEADGVRVGVLERMDHDTTLAIPAGTRRLDLLVEDLGRVDYGPRIGEAKGLVGGVRVEGCTPTQWETICPDLARVPLVEQALTPGTVDTVTAPTFLSGHVELEEAADLFLDTEGWGHGLVWMNGHLLGRFNRRGPQRTLYVPAPFLRAGSNDLLVFAVDPAAGLSWRFLDSPDLGPVDW
ncbi:MAG: beta-galactosidase [Propionibacterium sp.]|nr:beta-galactosidase [Propionibacterium sp.]